VGEEKEKFAVLQTLELAAESFVARERKRIIRFHSVMNTEVSVDKFVQELFLRSMKWQKMRKRLQTTASDCKIAQHTKNLGISSYEWNGR